MSLPNQEKWDSLFNLCDKVDKELKSSEISTLEISIPVLNQLRYVECHIRRVLQSPNHENEIELDKAIGHAKRAHFDIQEISVINLLLAVAAIRDEVGAYSHILKNHITDYDMIKQSMISAKNSVSDVIESQKNRNDLYTELDEHIRPIRDYITAYECVREEIQSEIKNIERKEKQQSISLFATIFATVFAAVLASVLAMILG